MLDLDFDAIFTQHAQTQRSSPLAFAQQENLAKGQEEGFTAVAAALEQQGQRLDEALSGIHGTVAETHRKVLDLQAELQRQGNLQHGKATETNSLLREVLEKISEAGMQRGEVRPQHSFSIRGEDERLAVKRLLERFRQLPEDQQRELPALLNGLGKLQLGAGDFAGARQSFTQVADTVTDNAGRAEAHYNAYRAALEEKRWDTALREMKEAAALDAQRFAPFPLERYEPKDILGAGGFGTAFLCRDHNFGEDVVVKALHAGDLERNTSDLFQEARLLRRLNHPAIIGVQECAFAQPAQKSRPYIVMDYFPGASLQAYLQIYGTLETEDAVAIARQVAAGIHTAHANHILHRDLKPDNILVRKDQDGWQVKIIDFGLALRKQTIETSQAAGVADKTILGQCVAGTLKYAPPEQRGELHGVDPGPYSDVYAFGKLCCYALFKTTEPKRRQWQLIPEDLAELLERCIEDELEHRHLRFDPILQFLNQWTPDKRTRPGSLPIPASPAPASAPTAATPKATAPRPGEIIENLLGMKFAWIAPGSFVMGSPSDEPERTAEETQHPVVLSSGFYMGTVPVTRGQFAAFVQATNYESEAEKSGGASHWTGREYKRDPHRNWRTPGISQTDNHPVVCVTWNDAVEFCTWLSQHDPIGRTYRLPTEAEWEYACRAGTSTPFSFGATISPTQANFDGRQVYGAGQPGRFSGQTTSVDTCPGPNSGRSCCQIEAVWFLAC